MKEFLANIWQSMDQMKNLEYWEALLNQICTIGPAVPILLAMIESFIPALPLVAIVAFNVAAYGAAAGFFYSWFGSCLGCTLVFLFHRYVTKRLTDKVEKNHERIRKAREKVDHFDGLALFLVICMPFTPSAFMNFAFGVSDYDPGKYLLILYAAKLLMIASLAFLGESLVQAVFGKHPLAAVVGLAALVLLYVFSKKIRKKHGV